MKRLQVTSCTQGMQRGNKASVIHEVNTHSLLIINTILMALPNLLISSFFPLHVSSFLCELCKKA